MVVCFIPTAGSNAALNGSDGAFVEMGTTDAEGWGTQGQANDENDNDGSEYNALADLLGGNDDGGDGNDGGGGGGSNEDGNGSGSNGDGGGSNSNGIGESDGDGGGNSVDYAGNVDSNGGGGEEYESAGVAPLTESGTDECAGSSSSAVNDGATEHGAVQDGTDAEHYEHNHNDAVDAAAATAVDNGGSDPSHADVQYATGDGNQSSHGPRAAGDGGAESALSVADAEGEESYAAMPPLPV